MPSARRAIAVKSVPGWPSTSTRLAVPARMSTRKYPPRVDAYTRPSLSPVIAVAGPDSGSGRAAPDEDTTVTIDWPPAPGLSTANDAVAASNTAAWACPASGRTRPAGSAVTGGDCAASAGTIVGGGASAEFAEQPTNPAVASTTAPARTS